MNTERIVSLLVVGVVVLAIGFSASALESSMTTEPEDAIDLDNEGFPLGAERGEQIQSATQRLHDQYTAPPETGATSQQPEMAASDSGVNAAVPSGGEASDSGGSQGTGTTPTDPGIDVVSLLVAALLWIASAVVVYRYRRRLDPLLAALSGAYVDVDDEGDHGPVAMPDNDVQRAWAELLSRAGIDQPQRYTPRICARYAIERGYDTDTVEGLRRLFEDVQYGAVSSLENHEQRAREILERLDGGVR